MKPRAFVAPSWEQEGTDPDWHQRRDHAATSELSIEEMLSYAEDLDSLVRTAVVARSDFPNAWLDIMRGDASPIVRQAVGSKPGVSVRTLQVLSEDTDLSVRATPKWRTGQAMSIRELCEHAVNTHNPEDLETLAVHPSREVRRLLARRKDLPERLDRALADDPSWYVRQQLLYNHKHLPARLFEKLADDPSWLVRKMVPRNKHCPGYIVEKLTRDASPWVRQAIVLSYLLDDEFVEPLLGDRSRQVSRALAARAGHAGFLARIRSLRNKHVGRSE